MGTAGKGSSAWGGYGASPRSPALLPGRASCGSADPLPFSAFQHPAPLDLTLLLPCLLSNHLKSQIFPQLQPLSCQVPWLLTLCSPQLPPA